MHEGRRRFIHWSIAAGATVASWPLRAADEYPAKQIRLLVGFTPGGGTDTMARALGAKFSEIVGVPVVIENKPGAGGSLAAQILAKSPADGSVLAVVSASHTINPLLYSKPPYEPIKDFTFVSQLARSQYLLTVGPQVPARSVAELIALAKAKPGQLNYASSGNGSPPHLATELFKTMTGTDMVHVPYPGTGPILTAMLSGQCQLTFANMGGVLPHIQDGKLRGLAVSGGVRSSAVPDLPTVAEAGVTGFEAYGWYGVLGPAGMPAPVANRLYVALVEAMKAKEVKEKFAFEGLDAIGSSPDQFRSDMVAEVAKWSTVVKQANMKLD